MFFCIVRGTTNASAIFSDFTRIRSNVLREVVHAVEAHRDDTVVSNELDDVRGLTFEIVRLVLDFLETLLEVRNLFFGSTTATFSRGSWWTLRTHWTLLTRVAFITFISLRTWFTWVSFVTFRTGVSLAPFRTCRAWVTFVSFRTNWSW